jgi:hypothetical protein
MVRSFSRPVLAVGRNEQQPVGGARRVFPARPQREFEDARDLLRRRLQHPALLRVESRSIVALDFDEDAIPHARRYNSAPNITFIKQDIRAGLPEGPFDNIVWDACDRAFHRKGDRIRSWARSSSALAPTAS